MCGNLPHELNSAQVPQPNLKLNLRHCTANYRPVLWSERASYMKNKESNCHSYKCNIRSPAPKEARHQDELADCSFDFEKNWSRVPDGCLTPRQTGRLTVGRNMTLTLRKIGRGSQMGAWHQDRLAEWLSVVNYIKLQPKGCNKWQLNECSRSSSWFCGRARHRLQQAQLYVYQLLANRISGLVDEILRNSQMT
jgi:hypothetical protein